MISIASVNDIYYPDVVYYPASYKHNGSHAHAKGAAIPSFPGTGMFVLQATDVHGLGDELEQDHTWPGNETRVIWE